MKPCHASYKLHVFNIFLVLLGFCIIITIMFFGIFLESPSCNKSQRNLIDIEDIKCPDKYKKNKIYRLFYKKNSAGDSFGRVARPVGS